MLKVYVPNNSKQSIGGGWTFLRNLHKGLARQVEFCAEWHQADVVLITGATMTSREEITQAKAAGKKVVFRIDNMPKDSRNRGTAFSRMYDFAVMADHIVFQSEWAKDYVGWWLKERGIDVDSKSSIIYNGVDPEYFFEKSNAKDPNQYLFVHYNRDENKRAPEAFYLFHQAFRLNKEAKLLLIGQFSPELNEYNFDFFAGEKVNYAGVIADPGTLGDIMRQSKYLLFPAYADAAPNTVLEALACGCEIVGVNPLGGSQEMLALKGRTIHTMGSEYLGLFNKLI